MSATNSKIIQTDAKKAAQKAAFSPVMEALTRLGYGVRGLIYVTMGLLALDVTLGKGGALTGPQGAIAAIGSQPAGLILLWIILAGLVSYSLWGLIRAVLDPLQKGYDLKGLLTRGGYLLSAVSYSLLILPTYGLITGKDAGAQGGAQSQLSLFSLMSRPWGHDAVWLIGLAVIAVGLYQVRQGFNASFDRQFQTYAMSAREVKLATQLGRLGTATRGFIIALVGGLMSLAAYQSNPNQPIGFDTALEALLRQPYGIWLVGIVGVGLMAFGLYSMLTAVWFRSKR